jgi:uncharacterized membrane protein YgcG
METSAKRRRRWIRWLVAATAMTTAGASAAVVTTMASAASVDTSAYYVIVNHNSGKAIDDYGWSTSNGSPVNQWTRNNLDVQQWQFISVGSGYYKIKNKFSGKVLELPNSTYGTQLVQNSDNGSTVQNFALKDSSNGYVRLINRHSNNVLDVWQFSTADGAKIAGYQDLDGWNQQWQLVNVSSSSGGGSGGGGSGGGGSSGGGSGSPSTTWPSASGNVSISGTVNVSGTFDGGMKRYCCVGSGSQSESQAPVFDLADGATLKNVIIGSPAGDGVHCENRCTIQNVWWEDVGEDAATFRGSGDAYVIGGGARYASDKVFQHNGSGTVHISGFYAKSIGKLYRACGNCSSSYRRNVVIDNVIVDSGKYVVGINTNFGDTAKLTRIVLINGSSTHVCAEYKGVSKGSEPTYLQDGWNDGHCIVTKSDVTYK